MKRIVLSHYQAKPLLQAHKEGQEHAVVSLDLNLSQSDVTLEPDGVRFPDGQKLSWESIEEIAEHDATCFVVENNAAERVQFFSPALNRFYSLMPTERAPTMLLSGFPMHRIKNMDPQEDTLRKIQTIAPLSGRVLDVCTGLGYTAIAASQKAAQVVTIELDPTVLEVARRNPWSQALFDNPAIRQLLGKAEDQIKTLENESFARIFHDPPMFRLAGDLYSEAFYRELYRVLKRGGKLFHYIGDLDSASGRVVSKGAVKRLLDVGFKRITHRSEAFGLVAEK